jgi:ribonuclease HII
MLVLRERHPGYTPRRLPGLAGYERALMRAGLAPVAGIDEAGRGACAGPLVVAAVALDPRRMSRLGGIADSKALSAAAREQAYTDVLRNALSWHVVIIPPQEIDARGLHVCNIAGMRRALAGLACRPAYALTDGFPVRGLGVPALAMWKGDEVAACVAAASVVAKVSRDRLMRDLDTRYPRYGFARHKGYSTRSHMRALTHHGPCPEHRRSFVNVGWRLPHVPGQGGEEMIMEMGGEPCRQGEPGSAPALEGYGLDGDGAAAPRHWPVQGPPPGGGSDGDGHPLPGETGGEPWWLPQGRAGRGNGKGPGPAGCPLGDPAQEN